MSTKKYEINQTCALLNVIPKSSEKFTLKLLYIFYKMRNFSTLYTQHFYISAGR